MARFPPVRFGRAPFAAFSPSIAPAAAGGWTVLTATTDLARLNSTTPTLDPFLFATLVAGKTYSFEIKAFFSANGAQDCKFTLGGTAGITRLIAGLQTTDNSNTLNPITPTLYTPSPFTSFPTALQQNTSLNEWNGPQVIMGTFVCSTAGTFGLSWSQNVLSAVSPTTRLKGSWMQYVQVD